MDENQEKVNALAEALDIIADIVNNTNTKECEDTDCDLVPDPVESDTIFHEFVSKVNETDSALVYVFEEPIMDKIETDDLETLIRLLEATKLEAQAAYIKRNLHD